jgi:hypothetical protein
MTDWQGTDVKNSVTSKATAIHFHGVVCQLLLLSSAPEAVETGFRRHV